MVRGSQTKVCELAGHTLVGDQDVLRLEVPVEDVVGMAELHGIQDLKESHLDESVIANEHTSLRDVSEEIAFGAILHDHIRAVVCFEDLYHGDDIGVSAGLDMEVDFSLLEFLLTGFQSKFIECLDRVGNVGLDVYGCVDDSVGTYPKDSGQLNLSGEDLA